MYPRSRRCAMRFALALIALLATGASGGGCGGSDYDPCDGKRCGDGCKVCPPDDSSCFETADVKACDVHGQCVSGPVSCNP